MSEMCLETVRGTKIRKIIHTSSKISEKVLQIPYSRAIISLIMPHLSDLISTGAESGELQVGIGVYLLLIPIFLLLMLSAFFSASETAYSSASKIRLRTMHADGDKKAGKALKLLDRYDDLLSTVLIGNNIVNIVMTTLVTVLFMQLITGNEALANVISTIVMTAVVLIFGEVTPKTLARHYPEGAAKVFYPFINFCYYILLPVNLFFKGWKKMLIKLFKLGGSKGITEEELVTIVETAESEGELDVHESMLIKNAIEFDDLEIRDIMVPRVRVEVIEDTEDPDVVADIFRESGFTRLPVYHDTVDSIIGILNEKDFNKVYYTTESKDYRQVVQPTVTVAPSMKISLVLRMLQRAKMHMAIVVDEFGGTAGIVTLEDILEELVGEIWDEHDEVEEEYRQVSGDEYIVSGYANLADVLERLGVDTKDEFDSTTVGGWVIEEIGTIPTPGNEFTFENLLVTVVSANVKRVLEVKFKVLPKQSEEEEDN